MKLMRSPLLICLSCFLLISCTTANNKMAQQSVEPVEQKQTKQYIIEVLPTKININQTQNTNVSLSQTLTNEVISKLTKTHQFIVKTQDNQAIDYQLISSLDNLTISDTANALQPTGRKIATKDISGIVNFQLIDNSTQLIVLSINVNYQESLISSISTEEAVDEFTLNVVDILKNSIIDQLYPIKVLAINESNQIVLDQSLPIGTMCAIFSSSDKPYSLYSSGFLNDNERVRGKLNVTHSTNNQSIANSISGYAMVGDICKRLPIEK